MNWFFLALLSAVFSAGAAVFQKKILFKIEALEFSLFVSIVNVIFLIPLFFVINYNEIQLINLLILYFKTILEAFAFLNVMLAIKNFEISKALPLLALTPGLVAVSAFFLLGDALSFPEVSGISLLIIGTYVLETKSKQEILDPIRNFIHTKVYKYILTALLLFTVSSILDRLLLHKYDLEPLTFLAFQNLFILLNFMLIFLSLKKPVNRLSVYLKSDLIKIVILISVFTIIYRYTQIEAIKLAPVALVLAVKRISIFVATLVGGKIFKEHSLLIRGIATLIIIAGTFLITVF